MTTPSLSVVIPTYDRCERLQRVLKALAAQTYAAGFETIVVSDGSTDGTDKYLTGSTTPVPVVFRSQANQGPAAARNLGVETARGELVVFLDDDVVPTPTLIEAHVAAHVRLGEGVVVVGPMLNPPDHAMSPWIRWEQAMLMKQYDAMQRGLWEPTARQFYTGNASLCRYHLLEAGGFDTRLRRAEDVELAYRLGAAGLRFAFEPEAVGLHYAERAFDSWLATGRSYGRNDALFARDYGQKWILEVAVREYGERRGLTRALVRLALGRRRLSSGIERTLGAAARWGDRIGGSRLSNPALSGIWNLSYYDGLAEELGGREAFWDLHRSAVGGR